MDHEPPKASTRTDIIALIAACAFFMEVLDATIIAPAVPEIARAEKAEPYRQQILDLLAA